MRSTFSQPFDEEFARLCIEECFPELRWDLKRNQFDPPDIIDKEQNVGIEVVRAVEELNAQIMNAFAEHQGELAVHP